MLTLQAINQEPETMTLLDFVGNVAIWFFGSILYVILYVLDAFRGFVFSSPLHFFIVIGAVGGFLLLRMLAGSSGGGSSSSTSSRTCGTCQGSGVAFGAHQFKEICNVCGGTGSR